MPGTVVACVSLFSERLSGLQWGVVRPGDAGERLSLAGLKEQLACAPVRGRQATDFQGRHPLTQNQAHIPVCGLRMALQCPCTFSAEHPTLCCLPSTGEGCPGL